MTAPLNENNSQNNTSICESAEKIEPLLYDYVSEETDEETTASVKAHPWSMGWVLS